MAIIDWIYPKKCLGCQIRGRYFCLECQRGIGRRGESLEYRGIVRYGIKEIKYRGMYDLVSELVEIWHPGRPEGEIVVTSVPMWQSKRWWRGYNQAELIAKEVAKRWGVEYLETLVRNRETRPMYGLKKSERLENVRGAFEINVHRLQIANVHKLILIDDVWTSGATIQECKRVLKRAGWKMVIPMALAS
ncbi:MAG: ComF family protein [Candidatus Moraniibacteriota bacterium]|nr:MAG: ComF family protein [Candidatus Moranbacteria bacterium]